MTLTKEQQAEVAANRKRYEELKAAGQGHAPRALPPPTPRDGATIAAPSIIHREVIPGGWYWPTRLNRGEALRLVNTGGTSCITLQAWSAADTSERLNHADTIKVQWAASLRKGRIILSDMGRVLFSIVEDTTGGAHDALAGGSTAATNEARYHTTTLRNTRDNFILAAGKWGLDRRDVHSCISFFAPVSVDAGRAISVGPKPPAGRRLSRSARRDGCVGGVVQLSASFGSFAGLRAGQRRGRALSRRAHSRGTDLCRTAECGGRARL